MSRPLRSNRPVDEPEFGPDDEIELPRPPRTDTVGALLRRTRQSYGHSLEQTAAVLRIRVSYLVAIEESRFEGLPGPVYAQGFVRAYALHFGLDGDEAVRRFKQESIGYQPPQDLSFPAPLAERSIPGGRMVLVALILAICGYGLWYYLSTGSRERPVRVADVPATLMLPPPVEAPVPELSAPATSAPAMQAPPATDAAAPAGTGTPAAVDAAVVTAAPAAAPADSPPAAPAATIPTPSPAPAAAPPAVEAAPSGAATSADSAPAAATPASTAAPAATATAAAPPPPPAVPDAGVPAAAAPAAPAAQAGRVYGIIDGPARVVIRAVADSWVQVREADHSLVAQRLLHAGDTLRLPDEPGLVMRTGNGAGLEITVDGRLAPALGEKFMRRVALDPARLLAGTAGE